MTNDSWLWFDLIHIFLSGIALRKKDIKFLYYGKVTGWNVNYSQILTNCFFLDFFCSNYLMQIFYTIFLDYFLFAKSLILGKKKVNILTL